MSKINLFPEEVLINIFKYIYSVSCLGQLRLVCKAWNIPAEKAMFSRKIIIKSNDQALMLYGHLFKNSSNGKICHRITFSPEYTDKSTTVMMGILDEIFTPNIQSFTGIVQDDGFYRKLVRIADESPIPYDELRIIPFQQSVPTKAYCDALLRFRKSLTTVKLKKPNYHPDEIMWNIVDRLDEFANLTDFAFTARLESLADLERVLKNCPQLDTLHLYIFFDDGMMGKEELYAWMEANVEKVYSLTKLTIADECRGDFFEYLTYKYPNVFDIDIHSGNKRLSIDNMEYFQDNMDRVFAAIGHIQSIDFTMTIKMHPNFLKMVQYLKGEKCSLVIDDVDDDSLRFIIGNI